MIRHSIFVVLLILAGFAQAGVAEQSHRARAAGIDLITYRTDVKQVVVIMGALPAGDSMGEPGNIAIPTLVGMMLDRGTKTLDKFAIADQLDSVGAEIAFAVGMQSLEIRAKCLTKDVPRVMGLLAAELRTPAFQAKEFTKAKQQFIGELQNLEQNTEARAREAFGRAAFPAGHPNRPHDMKEYETAAKAATLDELKAFYEKNYGPAYMTLVVAGDVADTQIAAEVNKAFAGWSGGRDYIRPAAPAKLAAPAEVSVPLSDKPSVSVILGQPTGLRYKDPEALALRVGTAILGRGFTGRLMGSVRDKEGLTYNIGASVAEDSIADGSWDIAASFAPALLDRGLASTRRELEQWWKDGVTERELATRKQGVVGGYLVSLSTTAGLATTILANIERGYDVNWLDGFPLAVNALTREQVNAAIKNHIDPASMVLVTAGSVVQRPK